MALKQRHLVKRSCHVEAARVHQDDIRVGGNNLVPMPAAPNKFSPPAICTSSGIQLPPAISGSIHSIMAARGRVRAVPLCLAMLLMRAEKRFQNRLSAKKSFVEDYADNRFGIVV